MSSEKQTSTAKGDDVGDATGIAFRLRPIETTQHWLLLLGVAVLGWLRILASYDWALQASSVFLMLGWLAILLSFVFLWNGVMTLVQEPVSSDRFGLDRDFRAELEHEKKVVLKAIKEIEFDKESGKMSEEDAQEIVQVYRVRAIDILKELEEIDAGKTVTARDVIDREVRARLKILGATQSAKDRAARQQKKQSEGAKA